MKQQRLFALGAFAVLLAAALAGCTSTPPPADAQNTNSDDGTGPALGNLTIRATEYSYNLSATTLPAGPTRITIVNEGAAPHHAQILRLGENKTVMDALGAYQAGESPAWLEWWGGPNANPMGGTATVIENLTEGQYVIVCIIPDSQGVPHVAHGMQATFNVTAAPGEVAEMPEADLVIDMNDYGFNWSENLTAGTHIIEVKNSGDQPHEVVVVKLNEGATIGDFLNATAPGAPPGPPPGAVVGGTVGIAAGDSQLMELTLTAGNYGLVCHFPDNGHGAPHFALGMVKEFTVA